MIRRNGLSFINMFTGINRIFLKNKKMQRCFIIVLITAAAAGLAVAVAVAAWYRGDFLPSWIEWNEKQWGQSKSDELPEQIILEKKHIQVYFKDELAWEAPENVLVQDFFWCDINHDGREELMLLCWRIGRYGYAKPYWVKKDEKKWSQHIFIYEWRDGKMHDLWLASDIGMSVSEWDFNENDRLMITEVNGRKTRWDWISWGLSFIEEMN